MSFIQHFHSFKSSLSLFNKEINQIYNQERNSTATINQISSQITNLIKRKEASSDLKNEISAEINKTNDKIKELEVELISLENQLQNSSDSFDKQLLHFQIKTTKQDLVQKNAEKALQISLWVGKGSLRRFEKLLKSCENLERASKTFRSIRESGKIYGYDRIKVTFNKNGSLKRVDKTFSQIFQDENQCYGPLPGFFRAIKIKIFR